MDIIFIFSFFFFFFSTRRRTSPQVCAYTSLTAFHCSSEQGQQSSTTTHLLLTCVHREWPLVRSSGSFATKKRRRRALFKKKIHWSLIQRPLVGAYHDRGRALACPGYQSIGFITWLAAHSPPRDKKVDHSHPSPSFTASPPPIDRSYKEKHGRPRPTTRRRRRRLLYTITTTDSYYKNSVSLQTNKQTE